jgi:divalent metal cation (Fe/Co/Zn/Cd) transporter
MTWNFTKSILLFAAVAGVLRGAVEGFTTGKWENGLGTAIWIVVLGLFVMVPLDLISRYRRGRELAGQPASKAR